MKTKICLLLCIALMSCGKGGGKQSSNSIYSQSAMQRFSDLRELRKSQPAQPGWSRSEIIVGICNDRRIAGQRLNPIGNPGGCGIANPVSVTEISGVKIKGPSTMSCATAATFADWIDNGLRRFTGRSGRRVSEIRLVSAYSCRTRSSRGGRVLSEHARGQAVDISSFTFKNGKSATILKGWKRKHRSFMRQTHASACGPFGTVLGPGHNRAHRDHLHFDIAKGNSNKTSFCR